MQKQTKIVATIGPASDDKKVLRELILKGLNVIRINFSHAGPSDAMSRVSIVDELNKEMNTYVAWLCDTKGPEIRTHLFDGGKAVLTKGEYVDIHMNEVLGDNTKFSITYSDLYDCVEVGGKILVDDGLIELEITNVDTNNKIITCLICNSGKISDRKGINVPNCVLKMDYLSKKDIEDIEFACDNNASYIAASFVRRADDVNAVRDICIRKNRPDMQIISKIENQEGVDNLDEIIELSDGIMVARGDLGTEIAMEEVPIVQKDICEKCNQAGKPVIIATQMLDSMERNPRPTRAEVGDVARAVVDGADSTMLSGETAKGDYPIQALDSMARICKRLESTLDHRAIVAKFLGGIKENPYDAIGISATEIANTINAKAIFVFTETGTTARQISKYRPVCPIYALSQYEATLKGLSLNWGVFPLHKGGYTSLESKFDIVNTFCKEAGFKNGERVIVTGGHPDGTKLTNFLKILEVTY